MAGIVRYGSYLPFFRLQRAVIGTGRGERAVASYDEDSVSMAVEAAREALRRELGCEPSLADLAARVGSDETRLSRTIVRINTIASTVMATIIMKRIRNSN